MCQYITDKMINVINVMQFTLYNVHELHEIFSISTNSKAHRYESVLSCFVKSN